MEKPITQARAKSAQAFPFTVLSINLVFQSLLAKVKTINQYVSNLFVIVAQIGSSNEFKSNIFDDAILGEASAVPVNDDCDSMKSYKVGSLILVYSVVFQTLNFPSFLCVGGHLQYSIEIRKY